MQVKYFAGTYFCILTLILLLIWGGSQFISKHYGIGEWNDFLWMGSGFLSLLGLTFSIICYRRSREKSKLSKNEKRIILMSLVINGILSFLMLISLVIIVLVFILFTINGPQPI
ncbi:MAG: hypothetical protein LBI13_07435 [Streptococcaceae bacterium]|jgi:Kef-type K+ transport system membrane component KefB|nr:hypothetical protein [Streptococcaceae bacterium]